MSGAYNDLDARSRAVFRSLVTAYLETGRPVGSRLLSGADAIQVSPATIRNIMQDLQEAGLLASPHTSAGRIPTAAGLRFYVDGMMERGNLTAAERTHIEAECRTRARAAKELYGTAGQVLSGLSSMLSLVIAKPHDLTVKAVHFMRIAPDQVITILVGRDTSVENRFVRVSPSLPDSVLEQASNYLNARLAKQPLRLQALRAAIRDDIQSARMQWEEKVQDLIEAGLAHPASRDVGALFVHGQSQLLRTPGIEQDLAQVQELLRSLDEQQAYLNLMDDIGRGDGVKVFIGAETSEFSHSGWSAILAPYHGPDRGIIGAVGVIGPTHLNYNKIVPLVDYTASVVTQLLAEDDHFPNLADVPGLSVEP